MTISCYKRVSVNSGVDVVYESVGGAMFDTCVNALAQHGRLIVIGWISGYETDKGFNVSRTLGSLPQRLLPKSASVRGFFLFGYPKEIKVGNNLCILLLLLDKHLSDRHCNLQDSIYYIYLLSSQCLGRDN